MYVLVVSRLTGVELSNSRAGEHLMLSVSCCNNGRGLHAILLLAGVFVTAYPALEYLIAPLPLTAPRNRLPNSYILSGT